MAKAMLVRRQLRRGEVLKFFSEMSSCLVGIEACASAHHWARELIALGHEGVLDASCVREAVCEAR
jgi:transposase